MKTSRASRKIQSLMEKGNVERVIKLLKRSPNVELRMESANALGEIDDEKAVQALLEALRDKHKWVRNCAFGALGRSGNKQAVEPLIGILHDEDETMRWGAIKALRRIGDGRAVEPLIETLQDEGETARRDAADALGQLGAKQAVEPLIRALKDKSVHVKRSAAEALGWLGDARAVGPLLKAIESWPSWDKWEDVGVALGRIGDERGIKALQAYLKDPDQKTRVIAADSLLKAGELKPGGDAKGYFVSEPPAGDGLCSDNECPCPGMGAHIPRGEGYLYISRSAVANRQHRRTESEAQSLIRERDAQIMGEFPGFHGAVVGRQGRFTPILCCRQGAERRELDLQVAAKDAAFWWETGLVPLRATPRA
jgi:HEAT repeat protein